MNLEDFAASEEIRLTQAPVINNVFEKETENFLNEYRKDHKELLEWFMDDLFHILKRYNAKITSGEKGTIDINLNGIDMASFSDRICSQVVLGEKDTYPFIITSKNWKEFNKLSCG